MSITHITSTGKEIVFNEQQEQAIQEILNWIFKSPNISHTLSGFAGTGKTTLVNYVLEDLDQNRIAVTAPTHKAKLVISKATGRTGQTIQALLGLRPNVSLEDFDANNPTFSQMAEPTISGYSLLIIDEASMLNKDLCSKIIQEAELFNVKVLFMGDEAQLPPINEEISLVFQNPSISKLTKVERQATDNPLMSVYDAIRNNLSSPQEPYSKKTNMKKGIGIKFLTDPKPFLKEAIKHIKKDPYKNKILCYTNNKVEEWNREVRKEIIGENTRVIEPGDILMAYNTIGKGEQMIYNSSDYKVITVGELTTKYGIEIYPVELEDEQGEVYRQNFIELTEENKEKFNRMVGERARFAKTRTVKKERAQAWGDYYKFKNQFMLLEKVGEVSKDFDYGFAITVHKSQGSTYDNVFVDEKDLNINRNNTERNKLKYVAFSRPVSGVYCLV